MLVAGHLSLVPACREGRSAREYGGGVDETYRLSENEVPHVSAEWSLRNGRGIEVLNQSHAVNL